MIQSTDGFRVRDHPDRAYIVRGREREKKEKKEIGGVMEKERDTQTHTREQSNAM